MSEKNMQKYRLSEIFYSIQGEGHYAGNPTLWARVFGCNLTCPGFPCDTEYSWNKDFKNDHNTYTSEEIFLKMKEMITDQFNPEGKLRHPLTGNDIHLAFTGGEPLLKKYQPMIMDVVDMFIADGNDVHFTIETNGTQTLTPEFSRWRIHKNVLFSFSPKLESVAGEKNAVNIDNVSGIDFLSKSQVKFVANVSDSCLSEVLAYTRLLREKGYTSEIWIMPKGETKEDQLKVAPVVEKYQQLGFKIATRNHCYIWSNDKNR